MLPKHFEQTKYLYHVCDRNTGTASNSGTAREAGVGCSEGMNQGEQGGGVTADQRRGSMRLGKASEQRGMWVDPATQQVGAIAEHDPGTYAFALA